jgi:hypothetical protein
MKWPSVSLNSDPFSPQSRASPPLTWTTASYLASPSLPTCPTSTMFTMQPE